MQICRQHRFASEMSTCHAHLSQSPAALIASKFLVNICRFQWNENLTCRQTRQTTSCRCIQWILWKRWLRWSRHSMGVLFEWLKAESICCQEETLCRHRLGCRCNWQLQQEEGKHGLTDSMPNWGWVAGWLVGLGKLIAIYVPWHFCVWPSDWCRERSVCCRYLCFFRKMQIVHPNDGNLIRSLIGHSTPQAINTRQLA